MKKFFSGCELVELAIQIEKNGKDFFGKLSEMSKHPVAKEAFAILSKEDSNHMETFQKMFDPGCEYNPKEAYPDEYFSYMNSLASSYVFLQETDISELAKKVKNDADAVDLATSYVKDAVLFYEGVREVIPEKDLPMIDTLIKEEKGHLEKLCEIKSDVC
ncbi:MAG: ferritin family protein [Candidatus Omnitrophota bacterium]|jgi:rubrerythrin